MAQTIKLKRSATQGSIPATSALSLGEVAINTYDGKMYIKKNVGGTESIVEIGGQGGGIASSFTLYEYTATSGQTTFSGSDSNSNTLAYDTATPPKILVYLNGVLLDHTTDYTATNGTSVVLTNGAATSDLLQIAAYKSSVSTTLDIDLSDNQKLLLGDDDDLEIFHDGSHSRIKDTGTGNLILNTQAFRVNGADDAEGMIKANQDGNVELYYDGSKKFETTSIGVDITGALVADSGQIDGTFIVDGGTGVSSSGVLHVRQSGDGDGNGIALTSSNATSHRIWKNSSGVLNIGSSSNSDAFQQDLTGNATFTNNVNIGGDASFEGSVTVKDGSTEFEISGDSSSNTYLASNGEIRVRPSGTTVNKLVIGNNGNITTAGTISSGAITSSGQITAKSAVLTDDGSGSPLLKISADDNAPWAIQLYREDLSGGPQVYASNTSTWSFQGNIDLRPTYVYKLDGTTVIDSNSFRGLEYIRHQNSSNIVMTMNHDTYTMLRNPLGTTRIWIGSTGYNGASSDDNNYYNAGTHFIRDSSSVELARISSNGVDAKSGGFLINGTSVINSSRNIHNVGTISSGAITSSGNITGSNLSVTSTNWIGFGDYGERISGSNASSTLDFYTDATLALRFNSTQDATFEGNIVLNSNGKVVEIADAAIQWYSYPDSAYKQAKFRATDYQFKNGGNTPVMTISSAGNIVASGTISSGSITTSGYLAGPATFTIDPAAVGDNTGTVVIAGNLQVDGTTTTINSTTLTVDDKNITLASGSSNAAAANGAGLTVDCGSDTDATLTYLSSGDKWQFNKELVVQDGSSAIAFNEYSNGATLWLDGSNGDFAGGDYFNISAYGTTDLAFGYGAATKITMKNNGNLGIGTTSPSAKLQIEEAGIDTTTTSTTATTQVAIDTFAAATFRSARYTIQVTNSTDSTYHLTEVLLIHDGTTPQITEYGTIFTGSAEATFDADISSGNVRLLATPATTDSMTFKVVRHCITV